MTRIGQKLAIHYIRSKFALLSAISKRAAAKKAFELFCTPQTRNRKKLPPVFEKGEKLHFDFEGNTVRGYRWNKGAENKVLILHGYESSVINFDRYVKPLVKKGYEVLAFDAPAHGRSSGKRINVLLYKNMIHHINREFGPIRSILAHSLGGLTASLFLEETPHDESFRLVLIAPATETKRAIDNFFNFLRLDGAVRTEFDKLIEELGGKPPGWYSVARAAKGIRARVLFLQDKHDELTPFEDTEPIQREGYSNFEFRITDGLGHRRIYRDNQSFKAILDFL